MVKYLFVIFYLCVVMFLNLGHQLAKGETCGEGRRGNELYKPEVDHQTYFYICLVRRDRGTPSQ